MRANGDLWRQSLIWNNLAYHYLGRGDTDGAREALEKSISISAQCDDASGVARGRVNLSMLLLELKDFEFAEIEARKGLTEMEDLGNVPGIVVALTNYSAAICNLGRLEESIDLAERGIGMAKNAGMPQSECEISATLGVAYWQLGRVDEAREGEGTAATR